MEQNREAINKSTVYGQLIFDKGGEHIWGKYSLFNKWWCEYWRHTCKKE